ncbi:uncharacterized protein LOC112054346 isoform X3 [Bicyclus anynana]|uniref:Uncharacterized protein LOC112054346 isoform X3 n=1 Tax=Bicyclus anynana TaxID=110368 RepID=A0ABM3LUT2_BICAN|nr:uncharacterized protein LOC112054346 isoform X3 [Bicyclus anynana]
MSLAEARSARSSPAPDACPDCDTGASVTSDLHKYQVACTCKPASAQYACAEEPGPPPPAKTDTPPALPPRPPASVLAATNRRNNASVGCSGNETSCRRRKYAWWCCGCGALSAALGGLLAAQHILLRAYTASPHHLETVPAAVPAAMLVLTGVCIMSLARRRNRYSYMVRKIKVVGACCLVCALTCVLVTITTTVIHMNKLQTLKFCDYTKLTRTCTCYSMPTDSQHSGSDDDGVRCAFEGVTDCGVVHGALYWCLRGVFALSVSAVLVCIFSCMLAYQLLSHERKKMYWEQLELRCRSLYRPPSGQPVPAGRPVQTNCSCCAQCHTAQPAWDFSLQHRFWAPGRIGNLYSPNPGTGRKTSPWSWFPWPRGNSQNSRCRMSGVPQSGDSAYGFCENEPNPNPAQSYDERTYPPNFNQFRTQNPPNFTQNPQNFTQNPQNFTPQFQQSSSNFPQTPGAFPNQYPQGSSFGQGTSFNQTAYQEGFGEASGSFDAQTGVWGPPPPYSPQGRSGSRHHLHHQDPAAATLLHHHHIDHRNIHEHMQPHTCTRNYLVQPELTRIPDTTRINPEHARINPEMSRMNPELTRINPELTLINSELTRINPELARINPELAHMYPNDPNEIARLQEMVNMGPERFNTLRGHLVPYRGCQRSLGMSSGNLHCREDVAIECLHQKSATKVSDQSSDSCQKQGKENLGFQNDKHSPIRASMAECRGASQNAESEVYFADVSSCCNADCCINPNVSALVGTIENHPESTSESDTGSFTLTRQQRPQPQVGSKRRNRQTEKHNIHKTQEKRQDFNNSIRLTEQQIEHLNNSMRMSERMNDRLSDRMSDIRMSDRLDSRERLERIESRDRLNEGRIESRDRLNESRIESRDRLNDSRIDRESIDRIDTRVDRINDSRDRLNESRSDRMNDRDRLNDTRSDRVCERDSRIERIDRDRLNDSRIDRICDRDRLNDSRIERMNDSRIDRMSDRFNDSRIERLCDQSRLNDSRVDRSDQSRLNDSRIDRMSDRDRLNDSRIDRISEQSRLNDSRIERDRLNDSRVDRMIERDRLNDSRIDRMNDPRSDRFEDRRMSDLNASIRIEGSPKMRNHISPLRMPRTSPKNLPKEHPRQSSSDSKEFYVPPAHSPLSPNTEESLLSDDDDRRQEIVYSNEPEGSKCLGPDSQYEPERKDEILKTNHHHCYSDTNTMDSGWQSGSEKQVTD